MEVVTTIKNLKKSEKSGVERAIEKELVKNKTYDYDLTEMFGEVEMRWYQIASREEACEALENGHTRILVVQPTGTGKTLTIACTLNSQRLRKALKVEGDRKLRVVFVAHNSRLLTQADRTFAEDNNVELILQSTQSKIPEDLIQAGWDITVIDEAHHEAMASIQYQLEHLGNHPIIGLTATPDRADGCVIKFSVIINPISRELAVAQGYLAETDLYSVVDGAEKDKTKILKEIFNTYAHMMNGTMVFVQTKREVGIIVDHLRSLGYSTAGILNQNKDELNTILDEFSQGKWQFIVSVNRLGEGIDIKGVTTVVLGRTIGSYPLLNQIVGRAARPDCACQVFEIINPLSGYNLDTTCVVGTPNRHTLVYHAANQWWEEEFDYAA